MKNNMNTIFAITALVSMVASASVSADDISSVISVEQAAVKASGVSQKVEFAPVTIQDYIERSNTEDGVSIDSGSVAVQIEGWQDVLGQPVRL